jgi:hypothetical protein
MDPITPRLSDPSATAEELADISTPDPHSPDYISPSASASASAFGPCNTNTLRSCIFCRQRKVKCDRQQPCSNCLRFELECSYPAGRGRAKRRPPLVDRLQRLEDTIRKLASQVDAANTTDGASPATEVGLRHDLRRGRPSASNSNDSSPDASIDQQLGRLMIDDSKSYYVSNIMWANLGNEVCVDKYSLIINY